MKDYVMKKNYARAFKLIIVFFVILAVMTAVVIPLSLSQQISDAATLKQEAALNGDSSDGEHHHHDDEVWKSRITPLNAVNYAIIGVLSVLWGVLVLGYWFDVAAWLYKSAVNEGMNRSLWAILGAFVNIFAVLAFCIVRDQPKRVKA